MSSTHLFQLTVGVGILETPLAAAAVIVRNSSSSVMMWSRMAAPVADLAWAAEWRMTPVADVRASPRRTRAPSSAGAGFVTVRSPKPKTGGAVSPSR